MDIQTAREEKERSVAAFSRIAYVALVAAVALSAVHLTLPELRVVTGFLLPLPLSVACLLFGPAVGLIGICVACLGLWLFASWEYAVNFAAGGAVLAVVLSEHLRRGISPTRTIVIGVAALSLVTVIGLEYRSPGAVTLGDEEAVRRLFALSPEMERSGDLQQIEEELGQERALQTIKYLALVMPATLIMGALIYTAITFLGFRALVRRLFGDAVRVVSHKQFSLWHAPDLMIFAFIGCGVLTFVTNGVLFRTALNCLIVVGGVYLIQGLAVALFFVKRLAFFRALQGGKLLLLSLVVVTLVFLLLLHVVLLVMLGVGIADVFVDFRKIRPKQAPPQQAGS